jgi:hypothetical protein
MMTLVRERSGYHTGAFYQVVSSALLLESTFVSHDQLRSCFDVTVHKVCYFGAMALCHGIISFIAASHLFSPIFANNHTCYASRPATIDFSYSRQQSPKCSYRSLIVLIKVLLFSRRGIFQFRQFSPTSYKPRRRPFVLVDSCLLFAARRHLWHNTGLIVLGSPTGLDAWVRDKK